MNKKALERPPLSKLSRKQKMNEFRWEKLRAAIVDHIRGRSNGATVQYLVRLMLQKFKTWDISATDIEAAILRLIATKRLQLTDQYVVILGEKEKTPVNG